MIVSIIGLGYIGLPTAAVLASKGVGVIGVDVNQKVVDIVNKGEVDSIEPELDVLVRKAVSKGLLKAVTRPEKADVFIVAVPTPFENNYKPDLSYIQSAAKSIAPILEKGNTIILESTSPVGTTEKIIEWIRVERPDLIFPEVCGDILNNDISVAYCPERVLPGNVIRELKENDRIIGGITSQCSEIARDLYKLFVKADCLITDCRTAELSKLVENSFRDVNIAFANELSLICDKLDVNVWEMINLANRHPRVNILQPGPGVGGHCIAVDPWFIVDSAPHEAKLIRTARIVNDAKPSFVLDKIDNAVSETGKDKSNLIIACLGLTFKPDIDDLRHSPALNIAHQINLMNFEKVLLVEPNIDQIPEGFRPEEKLTLLDDALKFADIIVLLVDHMQFKNVNLNVLSSKKIIDTRGIWS
jgi:UDP-N-acetyl-D-mannosaminuronic acid dehydrogenase